jgi:hypothetical protein
MRTLRVLAAICISLVFAPEKCRAEAAPNSLEEHLVLGTVVSVNPGDRAIVIREANLFGQLRFQVRSYQVKQPSSLLGLRNGDKIMAVYSKKDGLLHRLRESRSSKTREALNKNPL